MATAYGGSARPDLRRSLLEPEPRRTPDGHRLRRDVQGLRAIAVLLVVAYHAGVPGFAGGYVGVDVFFVISGYLITALLLRELAWTGSIALPAFWARRVRRLLPAAGLVAAATVVAFRLWGPPLQVATTAWDSVWASAYVLNLRLGARGVDYLAASETVSPLQHYWSLSVEEQFYLLWPLLLLGAWALGRQVRRPRLGVLALVVLVAVGGLVHAVLLTAASAPTAYFATTARAWELAVGALIALGAARLERMPVLVAALASWAGLALVVAGGVVLDDATPFPGTAALLPVGGAALVVASGCRERVRGGAGAVLDRRPLQGIGRVSYGWYLWHWPLLVLFAGSLLVNVALGGVALVLAAATYMLVERPALRGRVRPRVWLPAGAAITAAVVALAIAVVATAPAVVGAGPAAKRMALGIGEQAALDDALVAASAVRRVPSNLVPTLESARSDRPASDGACHRDFADVDLVPCVYGDALGTRTVVLLGDSHAQQWLGALDAAAGRGWRVVALTKAACPMADLLVVNPTLKREYVECPEWRDRAIAYVVHLQPDLVLVSQSDSVPSTDVDNTLWAERTVATLERLRRAGLAVTFLRDTPVPREDVPTCLSVHLDDVRACGVPRSAAYHASPVLTARHVEVGAAVRAARFPVVEPAEWLCTRTFCPVVVGDELVYRDDSHLTNTFATTLSPMLAPLLARDP